MLTLKGVFPEKKTTKSKNFIRENVRNIRRISVQSENKSKGLDVDKEKKNKRNAASADSVLTKRHVMCSKFSSQENCHLRQTSRDDRRRGHITRSNVDLVKTSSDSSIKKDKINKSSNFGRNKVSYVSRGIQTSFENDNLGEEINSGQSSSRKCKDDLDDKKLDVNIEDLSVNDEPMDRAKSCSPLENLKETQNYLTNGDKLVANHVDRNSQTKSAPKSARNKSPTVPKHRLGEIPKYLLERKEAMQKEKEEKEAELAKAICPRGHIMLPDQERKETLTMLKKNYQDCINELNRLPIRSDTLRSHQRKIELEKKLNTLEDGIKVFSRPKVFVKVDS